MTAPYRMFWIGEETEVIAARSLHEAAEFVGENADDPGFKGGEVDYDLTGRDPDGNPVTLGDVFLKFIAEEKTGMDYLWTQYGD